MEFEQSKALKVSFFYEQKVATERSDMTTRAQGH